MNINLLKTLKMKKLHIIIIALLLSTLTTYSQMKDKIVVSDYDETRVVTENNQTIYLEQSEVIEEITPFMLDPNDKYKLNQDLIYLPTQVTKTLRLDSDKDIAFDKKIKLNYLKPEATDFDFFVTRKGIRVETINDIKIDKILNKNNILHTIVKNKIMNDGLYEIYLENGEKIQLEITDYKIIK